MLRWIVSLTALITVSSVFAQGTFLNSDTSSKKGSFYETNQKDPTPSQYCNPAPPPCNAPPTQCVPEPASFAALAIGGFGLIIRRKKKNS